MIRHHLIILLLLLSSCSDNSTVSFAVVEEILMEEIDIPELLVLPSNMFSTDDNIIITQRKANKLFWFFDSESLTYQVNRYFRVSE